MSQLLTQLDGRLPARPPTVIDGEDLFEVINGRKIEAVPMGAYELRLATILTFYLEQAGRRSSSGIAVMEMLFELSDARHRRPDVAFVSYERWPRHERIPRSNAWSVIPDLAIEVISRTNTFDEIEQKVHEYFTAGVNQVWVVSPAQQQQVYCYSAPTESRILSVGQSLTGGDLLSDFTLPLADLFEEGAADDSQTESIDA